MPPLNLRSKTNEPDIILQCQLQIAWIRTQLCSSSYSIGPCFQEVAPLQHEHFQQWRLRLGCFPVCQKNPFLGAELIVLHTVLLAAPQILTLLCWWSCRATSLLDMQILLKPILILGSSQAINRFYFERQLHWTCRHLFEKDKINKLYITELLVTINRNSFLSLQSCSH